MLTITKCRVTLLVVLFSLSFGNGNAQTTTVTPDKAATPANTFQGIRAVLIAKDMKEKWIRNTYSDFNDNSFKHVKEFSVFTFDFNTLAMHVDQATLEKRLDLVPGDHFYESEIILMIGFNTLLWKVTLEEKPMYFDYEGYVYTKGKGKKSRWIKTPVSTLYKMMKMPFAFASVFPELGNATGNYSYYGIDVSPGRYPILEWAFRYKMKHFEDPATFSHEFLEYGGEGGHSKYTLLAGKDKGSFVVFDGMGRLREINTINSGMIQYNYGNYTVKLPEARETEYFSDHLQ